MRIVIKPVGIFSLVGAIAVLSYLTINNAPGASGEVLPGAGDPIVLSTKDGKPINASGKDRTIGQMQMVFDNAPQHDWKISGSVKDLKADDSTTDANGSGASITASFPATTNHEAIVFDHPPFDSAPYDRITMKINGGAKGGQKLKVAGILRGKERKSVSLDPLPTNKWQTVTVKLADLGVARKFTMTGFSVQSASADSSSPIHVDDVRLLTPNDKE